MDDIQRLYLDLLKKTLLNLIYVEYEHVSISTTGRKGRILNSFFKPFGMHLVKEADLTHRRQEGTDWPAFAHTMVGIKRLDNLQNLIETILKNNVPGDFIETGVWRGGSSIFMRGVLKAHDVKDRTVWVADSFEGLPKPTNEIDAKDPAHILHGESLLAISLDTVKQNFSRYGLLDDQVKFIKGWFRDTLPTAPVTRLALMRLDGDFYSSTMEALTALYPKLSAGGFVIIDDYFCIEACKQAVSEFREAHKIQSALITVDSSAVYWRKD